MGQSSPISTIICQNYHLPFIITKVKVLVAQSCLTLCELQPARLFCPWDSPGKNTGVGCHFLLQGIFPTQGSNPYCISPILQADSLPSESPGKPRSLLSQPQIILAFPSGAFSSGPAFLPFVILRYSYGHHQHFCHAPIFPAQNFQESKYTVGSEKTDGPRLV